DTFGFHARGPCVRPSLRVEIWAYGRRSPFLPWAALVPWTTTALGRRSVLSWKLGDLLEKAGLKKNRWRAQTGVSAFDPPLVRGLKDDLPPFILEGSDSNLVIPAKAVTHSSMGTS